MDCKPSNATDGRIELRQTLQEIHGDLLAFGAVRTAHKLQQAILAMDKTINKETGASEFRWKECK